ncbi:putative testis-specific Y-encoded-like protein 3 [Phoca vitulina]|uniref:putative testis-specific Y-encoded-like protein 3 n=1 Tax=Phoca vitulina TaxID=9720 RepID=UPI00139607A8|nr:putative testis-specific Y-encoded-like protein 3 [Phoca vitulina]
MAAEGAGGGGVCLEPPRTRHPTSPLGSAKVRHAGPPPPRDRPAFSGAPGSGLARAGAPETCGARGRGARAGGGGKAEEVTTGQGAIFMEEAEGWRSRSSGRKLEVGAAAQQGPGPLNLDGPAVDPLEAIQWELEAGSAQADRAYLRLQRRFGRIRRLHLAPRSFVVRNIPGFWVTAFLNHPQLLAMIITRDEDMLCHLMHLEVRELRNTRAQCKFKFRFWNNPYFRNKVLMKEYECRSLGPVVSVGTRIRGHPGQARPVLVHRDTVCSFFTWFSQHSLPEADKVAQIIKEDLWPKPLQYHLLEDKPHRARRGLARWPTEAPPRLYKFQFG